MQMIVDDLSLLWQCSSFCAYCVHTLSALCNMHHRPHAVSFFLFLSLFFYFYYCGSICAIAACICARYQRLFFAAHRANNWTERERVSTISAAIHGPTHTRTFFHSSPSSFFRFFCLNDLGILEWSYWITKRTINRRWAPKDSPPAAATRDETFSQHKQPFAWCERIFLYLFPLSS